MTERERKEQREVLERLRRDAALLARRFGLPLRSLEAERPQVKRRYGICYEDGSIRIRLRHVQTRRLLRYSALIDTLCHELAHLRHFNHGPRFHAFYRRILAWARTSGIYRPQPKPLTGVQEHRIRRAPLLTRLELPHVPPQLAARARTESNDLSHDSLRPVVVRKRLFVQLELFGEAPNQERRQ